MDILKKNKKRWKLALAFLGIIIFLMWPKATSFTKKSIRAGIAPAEETTSNISRKFITFGNAIRGIGSSAEREQQLSLELVRAQSELNRLEDIEIENQRLLEALGFQQKAPYSLTPAIVVNRNISGWWSTLKIKPSNNQKLNIDSAVISPDGLVGRILNLNHMNAEVLLICDPAFRVAAKISGREIFGVVRGMGVLPSGHPLVRMEFINKDSKIRIGEEVTTSGSSQSKGFFPRGIHIGYIKEIYKDKSGLYQYAELVPRATSSLLDYLFVVNDEEISP